MLLKTRKCRILMLFTGLLNNPSPLDHEDKRLFEVLTEVVVISVPLPTLQNSHNKPVLTNLNKATVRRLFPQKDPEEVEDNDRTEASAQEFPQLFQLCGETIAFHRDSHQLRNTCLLLHPKPRMTRFTRSSSFQRHRTTSFQMNRAFI